MANNQACTVETLKQLISVTYTPYVMVTGSCKLRKKNIWTIL